MRTVSEKQLGKEFTEVLAGLEAKRHEPVFIHFQGKKFIVLREDEYQNISQKKEQNLTEFFRKSPLFGMELNMERDKGGKLTEETAKIWGEIQGKAEKEGRKLSAIISN